MGVAGDQWYAISLPTGLWRVPRGVLALRSMQHVPSGVVLEGVPCGAAIPLLASKG